jgi:predicted RNase H-like HicB family nuclease
MERRKTPHTGKVFVVESFTAMYDQVDDWWTGYVEELPGANAQERTLDEVRESLKEAVRLTIAVNRAISREAAVGRTVTREALLTSAA